MVPAVFKVVTFFLLDCSALTGLDGPAQTGDLKGIDMLGSEMGEGGPNPAARVIVFMSSMCRMMRMTRHELVHGSSQNSHSVWGPTRSGDPGVLSLLHECGCWV